MISIIQPLLILLTLLIIDIIIIRRNSRLTPNYISILSAISIKFNINQYFRIS